MSSIRIGAGLSTADIVVRDLDCNHQRVSIPFPALRVDDDLPAVPHALAFGASAADLLIVDRHHGRLYVLVYYVIV